MHGQGRLIASLTSFVLSLCQAGGTRLSCSSTSIKTTNLCRMYSDRTLVLTIEGENSPFATCLIILYLLPRLDWCEIQVLTINIQEIGCRSDDPICWVDYRFFVTCHRTFPLVSSYNQMPRAAVENLIRPQIKFCLHIWKHYYRPQRSCGQGYVFTRVCDSVHRGGLSSTPLPPWTRQGEPPPDQAGRTPPSPDQADPPWTREKPPPPTRQGEPPPQPPWTRENPSPGRQTSAYGQRAVGTHPPGMHSCSCM